MSAWLQISAFSADISADMLPAALPPPLRLHWPLPRGSDCWESSLLVLRPFGGSVVDSVHRRDTPDTLASCTFLVGWLSLTDCQPESRYRRQTWKLQCRDNVSVMLDISTSCASQCDSYLWTTVSAAAQGQEFATSVHPAAARLSVLWFRVMTAPTLGPSTCTLVRRQTYAHENLKDNSTRRRHCREYKIIWAAVARILN